MNVWQGQPETLWEHFEAAFLLGKPACGCQWAMSAGGRGLGNGSKKVSPNISGLSQPFNCMFFCCFVFGYEAFRGPGTIAGMKYNKVSSSFPSGDTLLQCAKSAWNVRGFQICSESWGSWHRFCLFSWKEQYRSTAPWSLLLGHPVPTSNSLVFGHHFKVPWKLFFYLAQPLANRLLMLGITEDPSFNQCNPPFLPSNKATWNLFSARKSARHSA